MKKKLANLENLTPVEMELGAVYDNDDAGDNKKDNEKKLANFEDPTLVEMELGDVDDNDDAGDDKKTMKKSYQTSKTLLLLIWN